MALHDSEERERRASQNLDVLFAFELAGHSKHSNRNTSKNASTTALLYKIRSIIEESSCYYSCLQ